LLISTKGARQVKSLLAILPNVEGGGTHKVVLTLMNRLNRQKFDIHLLIIIRKGAFEDLIPKDIDVIFLNVDRVPKGIPGIYKALRNIKPDLVFSATGNVNLVTLALKPFLPARTRFVARESTNISASLKDPIYPKYPAIMRRAYRQLYPLADSIICQSQFMAQDLTENFRVKPSRLTVIRNPVDFDDILIKVEGEKNPFIGHGPGPHIIGMGRLTYPKNFTGLIDAFADLHRIAASARLWIIGEGPMENELRNHCLQRGVGDAVCFPGFQRNPYPWLKHADLFVLSSSYEGMPNVLLEALACGCPVLATDCPGGTREIMELTGNNDKLVPLESFHIPPDLVGKPNNPDTIMLLERHFGLETIIKQYERLLLDVIQESKTPSIQH
jgi:glycosyltransferase involved in cell wall biosynthesis